eukprot:93058-Rhodomonas_salina.1
MKQIEDRIDDFFAQPDVHSTVRDLAKSIRTEQDLGTDLLALPAVAETLRELSARMMALEASSSITLAPLDPNEYAHSEGASSLATQARKVP